MTEKQFFKRLNHADLTAYGLHAIFHTSDKSNAEIASFFNTPEIVISELRGTAKSAFNFINALCDLVVDGKK